MKFEYTQHRGSLAVIGEVALFLFQDHTPNIPQRYSGAVRAKTRQTNSLAGTGH